MTTRGNVRDSAASLNFAHGRPRKRAKSACEGPSRWADCTSCSLRGLRRGRPRETRYLSGPCSQCAAVHNPPFEFETLADLNDQQLAEVSLALHLYLVSSLLRRDGFNLDKIVPELSVRALRLRAVTLHTELDFGIQLAQLTPDLEVVAGNGLVIRGDFHKALEYVDELALSLRVLRTKILFVDLLVDPVPADPFTIVPYSVRELWVLST